MREIRTYGSAGALGGNPQGDPALFFDRVKEQDGNGLSGNNVYQLLLAAKFNFDIDAIFADMQKRQSALGDRLVSPKTRAEPAAEADRDRQAGSTESTSSEAAPAA